jgi:hypothetical protein
LRARSITSTLGVTFEGFYQYNWNQPFDRVNLLRAYDTRANTFGIQQAAIVVESAPAVDEGRRFGARLDLQFGQATETVQGSPVQRTAAGRDALHLAGLRHIRVPGGPGPAEWISASSLEPGLRNEYAKDNNQFSRAYLFNFLPFYHSGFRLSLPLTDRVTVMYMLTNGIQQTEEFNNFKSSHVSAIVRPVSTITWTTSYFFGQEQPDNNLPGGPDGFFKVFDTYVTYAPTTSLGFGVDVNYVTNQVTRQDTPRSLRGLGAYGRYQLGVPGAVSVRYERLDDEGLFGGIAQVLQEVTATLEYKFAEGFLLRGEFRRDWSTQPFFTTAVPGSLRAHQNTALLGLVWWFGNKRGPGKEKAARGARAVRPPRTSKGKGHDRVVPAAGHRSVRILDVRHAAS